MEYGCIGEKLSHSFSKIIHEKIADYNYELKEVKPCDLDTFMKKADFKAINVTIPYKQSVIPYLYEISDKARLIGAVNTIVNKNGKLYGYNTDFMGMKALLKKNKVSLKNKKVAILGSGGTSKTAQAVSKDMNADTVIRVSRKGNDGAITYEQLYDNFSDIQIIINTTPCGMYPDNDSSPVKIGDFSNLEAVFDAIYNPLRTSLVSDAISRGLTASGGLYMLVAQAVFAAEKFLDINISHDIIDKIYNEIYLSKQNIVFIGMPGCGKTTIGKSIAEKYSMDFIDTDKIIENDNGIKISDIIKNDGEEYFRKIECETIRNLATKQSFVISTGGGAILNEKNIERLKQNGIIVFLDRPFEKLVTSSDRPLSSNRELLQERYNERYSLYNKYADITINADSDINGNVNKVLEELTHENTYIERS